MHVGEGLTQCLRSTNLTYLVQFGLVAGKGEGKAQGQLPVLYLQLLHEVSQTVSNVIEELKR